MLGPKRFVSLLLWAAWMVGLNAGQIVAAQGPAAGQSKVESGPSKTPGSAVGSPVAANLMPILVQEIRSGFKTRGVEGTFAQFCRYAGMKLDATAGPVQTSEITGNCRLSWYDRLLRNPLSGPAEVEKFTRDLHQALRGGSQGLDEALRTARTKLDLGTRAARASVTVKSPQEALDAVVQAVVEAQIGHARALSTLSRSEVGELARYLYPTMAGNCRFGHTLDDRGTGRRLCDLLEKMDRRGLLDAADALAPLSDPQLLKQLALLPEEGSVRIEGATGKIVRQIITPAGSVVIGGKGTNTYDLDKMAGVAAVIDLGGDDVYQDGVASLERPVLVLVDLAGNDRYDGTRPGIQGGAVLGVSMLVDVQGNDIYRAQDVAQGSGLGGVGILIDGAGSDTYIGLRRVQGQALAGVGMLVDRGGRDRYHAAMWAQGFGGPLGFGVLDDLEGNDHYYAGGRWYDSYPETPGYEGWSQGVGAGLRQVANGGIGVILDGGGDDVYEYDYMSQGGGYWLGLGFARDFGGNDRRLGGTQNAYDGGPRTETMFQRFACGFGCHYALGFLIDDAGDDTYGGTIMGLGFAWDLAVGYLMDLGGNDRYEATGGGTQGNGAQAGLGVIFDYTGNDEYLGSGQGYANYSISYHPMPACGGNFSFVIDYGGKDSYGCGAQDNTYNERGTAAGFLIDRPILGEPSGDEAAKQASLTQEPRS